MSDSIKIKDYGLGKEHNEKSRKIYDFISEVDFDNGDLFCLKCGGDGDNGEFLMDLLDAYFERFNNNGWIPVSERLPDNEDYVLCWYEYYRFGSYNRMYQTYGLGYYIKQYDMWGGEVNQGQKCRVIAWQPLPEEYKEV